MRKAIPLIALAAVLAAAIAAVSYRGDENPHEFTQNDCFSCHYTLPREGDTEPMRFMDTVSVMCGRCHDMTKVISHQVDIVPPAAMAIPKDMPLDESGRLTCVTCHDVHKPYKNPLTGDRTYFLRRDVIGKTFCYCCHNTQAELDKIRLASVAATPLPPEDLSHRPAMDRGHGFASFQVLDPAPELDPLSLACLDCHDEPGSLVQKTTIGGVWRHARDGIGLSHPVGVDYEKSAAGNRELVPADRLDKRLKLFSGKMGCCTCHDPYAPNDGEALVIGTKESFQDLCFACHIK